MSALDEAIKIATECHAGQRDKGGNPYILHPLRVMMQFTDIDYQIVAVLHDVLEDSPEKKDLYLKIDEIFGFEIVFALNFLTRKDGQEYTNYIENIAINTIATAVKIADLRDNLNASRLLTLSEADSERMNKYIRALAYLKNFGS